MTELPQEILDAYEAPWPNAESKAGVATFPLLVPITQERPRRRGDGHDPATAFRVGEAGTRVLLGLGPDLSPKAGQRFVDLIPGARELRVIEGAAHFLQEDKGEEIGAAIDEFIGSS